MHLYITEQGTRIRKQGNHLHLSKDNKLVGDYLISEISSINIIGAASISTDAISSLNNAGTNISLLNHSGHFMGKFSPQSAKNVYLRLAQYEIYHNKQKSFDIAKEFVITKIQRGITLLETCNKNPHNPFHFNSRPTMQKSLRSAIDYCGPDKNILRGIEGYAARTYFSCYAKCLINNFDFPGRKFHPCTDLVNSLLSLGYAFTTRKIETMLESYGFDTAIGYLHEPEYGRPSLALDILEEFRHPLVDRLVLKILNRKFIDKNDFIHKNSSKDSPIQLTQDGMKKFISHYEEYFNSQNRIASENKLSSWNTLLRQRIETLRQQILKQSETIPNIQTPEAA